MVRRVEGAAGGALARVDNRAMRTSMSARALVTFVALAPLLATACLDEPTLARPEPQEIRGGFAAGDVDRVFMLINPLGEVRLGSASNVKYRRCLLTAAHVVSEPLGAMLVYRGHDLRTLADKELQNVAGGEVAPDAADEWRDLAILWTSNQLTRPPTPPPGDGADGGSGGGGGGGGGGDPGERRIPLGVWSPQPMIDTLGLANAQYDERGYPRPASPSANGPVAVTLLGYGDNTTDANGVDIGAQVLRRGTMNATHFMDGLEQEHFYFTGGAYYLQLKPPATHAACTGDSGGPVYTTAGIAGVISTSAGRGSCATATATYATALNRSHLDGEISNWDWVHQAIARVCKKTLSTGVSGQGRVTGQVAPAQEHTEGTTLDNQIRCGTTATDLTDCGEFIHENQSIALTATPAAGWRFVRWYAMGLHCQCHGSTSTTCTINYGAMGEYTPFSSNDDESCYAEFEPIPPAQDAGTSG